MENEKKDIASSFARKKWLWVAVLSAVILGVIVFVVLSLTRGTELPEMDAWNRVRHFQSTNELDSMEAALDDYLWTFGDGKYANDARVLRERLKGERAEWEGVLMSRCTVADVDDYIYKHPDGFFHQEALAVLDSLVFLEAKAENSEEALMNYMEEHPDGRFVKQARELLKNVGKSEASKEECQAATDLICRHFKAMEDNSETIVSTMADNVSSYIGKPNPTVSDVMAYMAHFHKGKDEKRLEAKNFDVKKMISNGEPLFSVQFDLIETIEPDDTANCEIKNLRGKAILDAQMLMTSLVLEKVQ